MSSFYVLEGTSCCGKTSVLNELEARGFYLVSESNKMLTDFPSLPSSYSESRKNEKYIIEAEKQRCAIANVKGKTTYADRMIISSLAISYAWDFGSFKKFMEDVIDCIVSKKDCFLCDCTYYLYTSFEKIQKRNMMRENHLDKRWVSRDVILRMQYFYNIFFTIVNSENYLFINTDTKSIQEIADYIQNNNIKRKKIYKNERVREYREVLYNL